MIDVDLHLVHLKLLGFTLVEGKVNNVACYYFQDDKTGTNMIWGTRAPNRLQSIRKLYLILEMFEEMESTIEPRRSK
jgi:hypothetical protein